MVQVKAEGKYLPISPRKLSLLAREIKGRKLSEALAILDYLPQKGARILKKVTGSAMANAVNNFHLNEKNLFIKQIIVGKGPRYKRLDYSHGARFNGGLVRRRLSHLRVVLEEKEDKKKEAKEEKVSKKVQEKRKPKKTAAERKSKK